MKFRRDKNRWNHQRNSGAVERRKDLVERSKDLVMVQWTFKLLVAELLKTMWKRFVYEIPVG